MFIKSSFPSSFTCFPNQRLSPPHNISIFLLLHLSAKISSMAKALSRISFFLTINSDKNMVSKTPVFFLIFSLEIYTTKYMCVSNLFYDFFSCFWVISPICFRGILFAEKNNKEIMRERERGALWGWMFIFKRLWISWCQVSWTPSTSQTIKVKKMEEENKLSFRTYVVRCSPKQQNSWI